VNLNRLSRVIVLTLLILAASAEVIGLTGMAIGRDPLWNRAPIDELEHRTRSIPMFHAVYVPPAGDEFMGQALVLQGIVETVLGVQVIYEPITEDDMVGWTKIGPGIRAVHVEAGIGWTGRLEVLAHEAGHRLQPPVFDAKSSESEVFAETVSFLVCRVYGHDTLEKSANYLAVHKGGLHVLRDYRQEIEFAVAVLSGGTTNGH
jgi:hypothetical protein